MQLYSPSGVFRSHDTLKRLYDNRKQDIKRVLSREKQLRLKTGGGPEPKPEMVLDTADQILLTMINEKTVRGLENPVDCDTGPNIIRPISVQENVLIFDDNFDRNESSSSDEVDSTKYKFKNYTYKTENETVVIPKLHEVKLPALQSSSTGSNQPCWKKASDLKRKINPALQCNNKVPETVGEKKNARLGAQQSIKILASTDIAKKYNTLLDSRQILLEKQIEQANQELTFARTKHRLEIDILELKLAKKKREL